MKKHESSPQWESRAFVSRFHRIMLGRGSIYAEQAFAGGFVGVDYGFEEDLSGKFPEAWRDFNKEYIPVFLAAHPDKSKISAGLACGAVWTVCKGMNVGDTVLSPDGAGTYRVGRVSGGYMYAPGDALPHRRPVQWLPATISRSEMSPALQSSTRVPLTIVDVSQHHEELANLIGTPTSLEPQPAGTSAEDPANFALEKHLEEFLVQNWAATELGKDYVIFEEEGEKAGQQYPTDTGPIDILAIKKDRSELLVVELKKGRASDAVVGQVLRYMGYVKDELAEGGQLVRGAIVALESDQRIVRALSAVPDVSFFRYEITFTLVRA